LNDFSNRRKELKFAAADLKLYRRQQNTSIEHWDSWRRDAPPQVYFLWAARLRSGRAADRIERVVEEARALVDTYFEGAAVVAWHENSASDGYEGVPVPETARIADIDDVLYRIQSEITRLVRRAGGNPPAPVIVQAPVVEVERLAAD
jgi:hypothetical protein